MSGKWSGATTRVVEWHEPLMGTGVEVQIVLDRANAENQASELIAALVREMHRLQGLFSSVDSESEFSRWIRGEVSRPSNELSSILTETSAWHATSAGRFNPRVSELTTAWTEAEKTGTVPSPEILQKLASGLQELPWSFDEGKGWRPGIPHRATLNAFAKGWIVDRAIEFAIENADLRSVTINAGGDLRRSGPDALLVGIENPFRPFDNEPPLTAVSLRNGALATSGSARKGFNFGDVRFGHVIDPRTGWPVSTTRSISVIAPTAADADVLATMLGVETPEHAINEADERSLAVFVIDADQNQHRSRAWLEIEESLS